MLLSELIAALGASVVATANLCDCEVSDISECSYECDKGFIFAALDGCKRRGRDYIKQARARGAVCSLVEDGVDYPERETVIISKNARKTMAEIAKILYGNPAEKMKIVGITGTKGKSTVCEYLRSLLISKGVACMSVGTLGVCFPDGEVIETKNTTPSSPTVYRVLKDGVERGCTVAIIEVSSAALTDLRVYGIRFTYAIFTNLSYDHIGSFEHKNMREYFAAKRRLFTDYGVECAIAYDDGEISRRITFGVDKIIRVGGYEHDEIFVHSVTNQPSGTAFYIGKEQFRISLSAPFNAYNAALALACASELTGKSPIDFANALPIVRVRGRFEIYDIGGVSVVIDYAHNEDSIRSVISFIRGLSYGRIISVFGSVGGRERHRRRALAVVCDELCDLSVITADNPDFESAEDICNEIASYFTSADAVRVIPDREEAIKFAISLSRAGDFVLLLGKGHESYQLIGGKRVPFSEREIVKALGGRRG